MLKLKTFFHSFQTSTSLRRRRGLDSRIQTAPSSQRRRSLTAMASGINTDKHAITTNQNAITTNTYAINTKGDA